MEFLFYEGREREAGRSGRDWTRPYRNQTAAGPIISIGQTGLVGGTGGRYCARNQKPSGGKLCGGPIVPGKTGRPPTPGGMRPEDSLGYTEGLRNNRKAAAVRPSHDETQRTH